MVDELFSQMTSAMWTTPVAEASLACRQKARHLQDTIEAASTSSSMTQTPAGVSSGALPVVGADTVCMSMQEALFDPDKILCCAVESGHTLVHGSGGRGYGLGAMSISSGCYQWKVSRLSRSSPILVMMCLCQSLSFSFYLPRHAKVALADHLCDMLELATCDQY